MTTLTPRRSGRPFAQRLLACQRGGNLTVADLARWFDRPYQTVRSWIEGGSEPGGGPLDREHAHGSLASLEGLIRKKKGFPMPRMSPKDRGKYLEGIRG